MLLTSHRTPSSGTPDRGGAIDFLADLMGRLGRPRVWIASATVFVVFAWVFFASSAPFAIPEVEAACGQQPLDMRFYTSADGVHGFLEGCGGDGRDAYRAMQVADLVYPTVVGLFLASSLALVFGRLASPGSNTVALASLPLAASSFDYLENLFAWFALARYPNPASTDVLLGYASAVKTTMSWCSGLLLLGGLGMLGLRLLRPKARPIGQDRRAPQDAAPTVSSV